MALDEISAMLKGVEKRLRAANALNDLPGEAIGKLCAVRSDGRPPPNCGQKFYAVHFSGMASEDVGANSLDTTMGVTVTLTWRMGYAPNDRRMTRAMAEAELFSKAIWVRDLIHQQEAVRILANLEMGLTEIEAPTGRSDTINAWIEPLRFLRIGTIVEQSGWWVGAAEGSNVKDILTLAVDFGRARLVKGVW